MIFQKNIPYTTTTTTTMHPGYIKAIEVTVGRLYEQKDNGYSSLIDITSNTTGPQGVVEVRPSTHGKGVFTKQDIKKGDCVTFYPMHQFRFMKAQLLSDKGHNSYYEDYGFDYSNEVSIAGRPDIIGNELFLGHMINDPTDSLPPKDTWDEKALGEWFIRYMICAQAKSNVAFKKSNIEPLVEVRATKDIPKDTELLVVYSPHYWVERNEKVDIMLKYVDSLPKVKRDFFRNLCSKLI